MQSEQLQLHWRLQRSFPASARNPFLSDVQHLHMLADVARALVPRSVTVALALPIAAQLSAPASITAAGVALTGPPPPEGPPITHS